MGLLEQPAEVAGAESEWREEDEPGQEEEEEEEEMEEGEKAKVVWRGLGTCA